MSKDLEQLRREYTQGGLSREQLAAEPMEQFEAWLQQAIDAGLPDPTAMTVATVSADGKPSQRIVLLKKVGPEGFVFYTNLQSRKAQDIRNNSAISLHFPWHALDRQVKVVGVAQPLGRTEVLKYFLSRPKDSQIAAAISEQSRTISSRQFLLQQFNAMKEKLKNKEVPLPDSWGGFRVEPEEIEFWQGGEHRLHDRFRYTLKGDQWEIDQLAP